MLGIVPRPKIVKAIPACEVMFFQRGGQSPPNPLVLVHVSNWHRCLSQLSATDNAETISLST